MKLYKRLICIFTVAVLMFGTVSLALQRQPAEALNGGDFRAGNIIADGVFYDGGDMSLYDVQNFLNSKVPVCDTWGAQQHSSGVSRATYGASRGYPAPYTCLKEYRVDTPERQAENGLCTGLGAGNKSAAQIIYEVGLSCGVNPKALIVLLQKEQSLITDDWPWSVQYQKATGYGCPDTAPCNELYFGFFNQVYMAARQYKKYVRDANIYNYRAGVTSNILYNPNSGCGASGVGLQNYATAGLYNYTPYQPNQAALNNLDGTGDNCSSYGNRNFWKRYNEWFGSSQTSGICVGNETPQTYVRRFYNHRTFQHFYSAYDCDIKFLARLGYVNEGPAFNTTPCTAGYAVPVYRLYNPTTRLHFWTTTNETPEQLQAGGSGFRQEAGVVFCVATPGMPGVHGIHRLYNPKTYIHVWAVDPTPSDLGILSKAGFSQTDGPAFSVQ